MKPIQFVILIIASFLINFGIEALEGKEKFSQETYEQLDLFANVFERVRKEYVEEVLDKELIEAAINGMLTSLDPHSSFLSSDSFEDMQANTKGEFGGLGIEVTMENGFVKVVSPIDDTPAYNAGLQPNDFIIKIDGENVLGLNLSEAVELMRGPVDTDITISISRQDVEPFEVTLTRAIIKIRSVRHRIEENVGYIRITSFNEQTQKGLEEAILEIKGGMKDSLEGFVLDLRNNPGGLLDQAISVADTFLDRGEIVSTRSRYNEDTERTSATAGDLIDQLPLIVLINDGSASASEIVAGALQDHKRAIILGTKSFGKGSVQKIIPMQDNSAMRLTTARYYTPSGQSIQGTGIKPDIMVLPAKIEPIELNNQRSEAKLRGALKNDTVNTIVEVPGTAIKKETPDRPEDYQLLRAIDLIQGISMYNKYM
jgi:carboxyl-terminal processing protease